MAHSDQNERRLIAAVLLFFTECFTFPSSLMAETMAPGSQPPKSAVLERLRISAAKRGTVRVIISVAPAERGAEATPEIDAAKKQLIGRLHGPDAPTIESIEGTPYVILEVTPNGVDSLAADPAVQGVQEDRPERAQ